MPKVSNYTRTRIEFLHKQGLHPAGIFRSLKNEGLLVSLTSISRIVKKVQTTGSVANLPRSGRPTKLSVDAKAFIDQQMRENDETTSQQIQKKLARRTFIEKSREQTTKFAHFACITFAQYCTWLISSHSSRTKPKPE